MFCPIQSNARVSDENSPRLATRITPSVSQTCLFSQETVAIEADHRLLNLAPSPIRRAGRGHLRSDFGRNGCAHYRHSPA